MEPLQATRADTPAPHHRRLGIFGGTFDPVHNGHLALARAALKLFDLHAILWIPTWHPPHKSGLITKGVHRRAMVEAAIARDPQFHLGPPTAKFHYAIDTFTHVQILHPNNEWYWLLGSDTFKTLPRWYQRQQLIPAVTWLVFPRLTSSPTKDATTGRRGDGATGRGEEKRKSKLYNLGNSLLTPTPIESSCEQTIRQLRRQEIPIRWHLIPTTIPPISSTQIRQGYCQGRPLSHLLPKAVLAYITTHQLYP
ncbi:MAG: nicotinate (nicotinamide) nucleotide adenylyltransferase [Cyanobacteriota bacterium]|nr:nicotinate (nicotinamide) nucleotide adenylyltransferase [Cyanobacteriota bacterium]